MSELVASQTVKMRSESIHIPVIMHTNSLISNFTPLSFDCDSAYDSRSDSENSESLLDVLGPEAISSKSVAFRSIQCKWVDCGKTFSFLDDLAAHVTSFHANSGPGGLFFCGWEGCNRGDRGFNARYKMLVHVRTHTNEKPHRCFQCEKSFSRAENLKIHARSHTGEKPYVCPVPGCGKAYSNSSDRFKHTRTHSVDKPYVCKVPGCGKKYTDPSSLRKHVKTYRHFPTNHQEIPVKEVTPIIEEMDHEQIVPETDTSLSSTANPCSDSSTINYYYNFESDKEVSFRIFKNWFKGENLKWYPDDGDSYSGGYPLDLKEQDVPLDLTVHK